MLVTICAVVLAVMYFSGRFVRGFFRGFGVFNLAIAVAPTTWNPWQFIAVSAIVLALGYLIRLFRERPRRDIPAIWPNV